MFKLLVDNALHKYYGINQNKDSQPIISGSNKVCVVSLIFFKFLKLISFSIKNFKKMKNANDQNFFNFAERLRQRVIRYLVVKSISKIEQAIQI